jgi:hypothetical protein
MGHTPGSFRLTQEAAEQHGGHSMITHESNPSMKQFIDRIKENLIQKRNAARERHNQMKKEFLILIGKKTGIEFEMEALRKSSWRCRGG